jgi:hypothetical protein
VVHPGQQLRVHGQAAVQLVTGHGHQTLSEFTLNIEEKKVNF